MKKCWAKELNLVLMLVMLVSLLAYSGPLSPGVAYADMEADLLNETFDGMTVGSTPGGWGVNVTGASYVAVAEATGGNRYLHIADASIQSTQGIYKTFSPSTGKLTLEADVRLPAGATSGKENFTFYVLDSSNNAAISLVLTPTTILTYRTTSGVTTSSALATGLALHEWRKLMIAADVAAQTFDFYLDGQLTQSGVPFRYDATANLTKLQVTGAYYPDPTSYTRLADLDNVRLYPYPPNLTPADLLDENFDGLSVDSTPGDWGVNATGLSSVKVEEDSEGDHHLHIRDASIRSSQGIFKAFAASTGLLTFEADIRLPAGSTSGKENIAFYILDSSNKPAISLILTPTTIVSYRTTSSGTTSTVLASGLGLNAWRQLAIAADYATKTFDLYVNGELKQGGVDFRYDDAANMAKLQVTGVYYDDANSYVRLADLDNVRIYPYLPDIPQPEPAEPPAPGVEKNSFDSYSSVFLSSRLFRPDGSNGDYPGTLDILKRFMVTDDKWTYDTDPANIKSIVRLGIGFQGALNMNMGTGGRAEYFDGTPVVAPWMSWGSTWGSMSNPVYFQYLLDVGKKSIDAGVRSFQFDDWQGGINAYIWGGDFSSASLVAFREYLDETYSTGQLDAWGISDLETFNYKIYLQTELGIQTNSDYLLHRAESPLDGPFRDFMMEETVRFHEQLHQELEVYAGQPLEFSFNSSILQSPAAGNHALSDMYDYGIGETQEHNLGMSNLVAFGALATGLGKPQVISPYVSHTDIIRQSIASAYALGQYMLVPWDIWTGTGTNRYFGTVEEYGDLYQFIRQYPYLFDGNETPAKAGILIKWSEMNPATLVELSMRLFQQGVPFKAIVVNDALPRYELNADQLAGLEALIAYSPLASFSTADQATISASGIPVLTPSSVDSVWLAERSSVLISGGNDLYATVRASEVSDAPKVIHLINRSGQEADNVTVTLTDADFFGGSGIHAELYRPGQNPYQLAITTAGPGKKSLAIPRLNEWGIVRVGRDIVPHTEPFVVPVPWSGISIGNPLAEGAGMLTGETLTVTSKGKGLHVPVFGDSGSSDQFAYVYQKITAGSLHDISVTTELQSLTASPAGSLAGLMVRETAASNAKFVAAGYVKGNGLQLYWRDEDNGPVGSVALGQVALPGYLKLARHAGMFAVYYSTDGVSWGSPLTTRASGMKHPLAGAFAAAGTSGNEQSAAFDHLAIDIGEIALPPGELTSLQLTGVPEQVLPDYKGKLTATGIIDNEGNTTEIDVSGENIVYTSSNTEVATVGQDGAVSALGVGSAVISASFTAIETTVTANMTIQVSEQLELVNETFDANQQLPFDWNFSHENGADASISVLPYPSESDRSLAIYDNTTTRGPSGTVDFEPQRVPVTVDIYFQADFQNEPATGGAVVAYLQSVRNGTTAISLLAGEGKGFWYLDGTTSVTVAPIVEEQWYHIRLIAYPDTKKMDLYIDGMKVVNQGNFRNSTDAIDRLYIGGTVQGAHTTSYWKHIRISAGVPDLSAPETVASLCSEQPEDGNHHYSKPVTVQLDATDDLSGVQTTEYSLDNGVTWTTYMNPITFDQSGTYDLVYRSIDKAGNREVNRQISFTVELHIVAVLLTDSSDNPISGGIVKYYDAGWKDLGVTGPSVLVSKELLPGHYTFSASHEGLNKEGTQNTSVNPTMIIQI